jgi:epoxyqueuosine reductase
MESTERILDLTREMGIPVVGFADVSLWDSNPLVSSTVLSERRPSAIMPGCRTAIVIGIPVQYAVVATAPSVYYSELYKLVNGMLDRSAQRLVMELEMEGHSAVFIPRDGYQGIQGLMKDPTAFFSHKHAAYLAGLGTFGVNNTILTERYGPRIRFTTVLTDTEFPSGRPMEKQLCIKCMRCKRECPQSAIGNEIYPASRIDKQRCVARSFELSQKGISPCGRCIVVCPVGNDRGEPPTPEAMATIRSYEK